MYAATGGPNVKWGGGRAPLPPPLATNLASHALVQSFSE